MKYNDIIKLTISRNDVVTAIIKAKEQDFIDTLRERHVNIQIDRKLRRYIGEMSLKKCFLENGIKIKTTNYFDEEYGMDIDFEYNGLELELKTSLIPDANGSLFNVIDERDLKIIRRTKKIEDFGSVN